MSLQLHIVLSAIAKQLPLPALVRFAKANDQTCEAAQEAWDTWRDGCHAMFSSRMMTDRSWMDAYTRNVRQRQFRSVNGADLWTLVTPVPSLVEAVLQDMIRIPGARIELRVRRDYTVIHLSIFLSSSFVSPALVIANTGHFWRFGEHAETCFAHEQKQAIVGALEGLASVKNWAALAAQPPPPLAPLDKHQILAGAAFRHLRTSAETRIPDA